MDDRTRVVVTDFGAGLAFLWLFSRVRRWFPDGEDASDLRSLVIGALSGFLIQYVSERDPIAPKLTHYRNQLLFSLGIQAWNRLLQWFSPSRISAITGTLVGVITYLSSSA
jgi:hypothetical protein